MDSEKNNSTQNIKTENLFIESLSPNLAEQVLNLQTKELALRQYELEVKGRDDENRHQFAKAALQVKAGDITNEREHERHMQTTRFIFFGVVLFVIAGVISYALTIGKDGFAMELIKAIIFLLSGGAVGFAIGKSSPTGKEKKTSHRDSWE